jgi:parallel beta-helix repeat protein
LTAWSDGIPCLAATVFYVEPCCFKQSRYTYSIDGSNGITFSQALGVPTGTTVVLSSSGFVVGGMTYTNLLISGIVSVDLDLYFDNNLVVSMMADASIVVQSGYRLTVDNHSIIKAACKEMWKSIWVSGGGEIVLNNGAVIQDGEFGTFLMGDAKITSGDQGDQVVYNKNYFGMFFLWHNAPSNVLVRNTRFMCRASGTTLTNDDELLLPHQGEHSAVGIALAGTQTALTIGEAVNGKHNEFDFLDYGILSVGSQLNAVNNQFVNIIDTLSVFDCACNCPRGVGICADAEGSGSGLITQIGDFGPYEGNSVTDSDHGFYLVNNMNGIIRNNNLLRTRFDAMNFNENWLRNGFYEVDRNTSKGVGAGSYHIFMNNNPNVNKTIVNNEINEQYVPSNLYATGIGLFEMVKAPATVKISDNDLYNLGTGIYTLGLSQTTIARNEIELNAEPNAIYGAGISANKGSRFTISENTITAANRDNWWVDGIRITDLVRSQVSCNLMQRTASGVFLNGNCTDTYIRQNNMRRNYWGYILNHAVNPLQQGGFYSDNIWTGPYDNNTAGGTYWHTLNMNSNVFANAINVRPYSGMGNVYKPNPFYSANSGGLNFSPGISPFAGPIYFPSGLNYHSGCNADTTAGDARHFNRQIVSGNFDGHDYKDNTKWLLRYQLFETLTEKGLEKMTDPFLIMFVDSMSNSAAGSLLRIQKSISDNGYADVNALEDIRAKNNSITTLNSIETLYRFVNDRILQTMINSMKGKSGDNSLHTEAMEKIKTIALMCPFESGPAVYLARALYQEVGKEHVTFLNPCETVSPVLGDKDGGKVNPQPYVYDPTEADDFVKREGDGFLAENDLIVFPNPADEFVRIQSQRSISRIEIMDVTAKGIHYVQGNNDFSIGIAMKDFAKGIYLMKVFYSEEEYVLKKLVVAH